MSARNGFGGARVVLSRTRCAAGRCRDGTAPFARLGRQRRGLKGPALGHAAQPAFGRLRRRRIGGLRSPEHLHRLRVDGRSRGEDFIIPNPSDMHFREARKVPKSTPAFD